MVRIADISTLCEVLGAASDQRSRQGFIGVGVFELTQRVRVGNRDNLVERASHVVCPGPARRNEGFE